MKKLQLLIIAMIAMIHMLSAQDSKRGGAWYLANGFQFIQTPDLNSLAESNNYASLSSAFGSGFGGYGEGKKLIIGGEGFYINQTKSGNGRTTQSYGGLGYFFAGWKLVNNERWKLFPAIGIGMGGITCTFTSPVTNSTSASDILSSQNNTARLTNGTFLFHTAIAAEYKISKRFLLGLKSGYNGSLTGSNAWQAPGLSSSLSVKDAFGGAYVHASLGLCLH